MTTYTAPECHCGAGSMVLKMARMDANYGQYFYRCPHRKEHPNCFIWVDELMDKLHKKNTHLLVHPK